MADNNEAPGVDYVEEMAKMVMVFLKPFWSLILVILSLAFPAAKPAIAISSTQLPIETQKDDTLQTCVGSRPVMETAENTTASTVQVAIKKEPAVVKVVTATGGTDKKPVNSSVMVNIAPISTQDGNGDSKQLRSKITPTTKDDDDDDDDDEDDEASSDDNIGLKTKLAAEEHAKRVKFADPIPEQDTNDWEVRTKKGKKASETAEQRAKRLQRQKESKKSKKEAIEQEALEKQQALEEARQLQLKIDAEEKAAIEAERISIAAMAAQKRRREAQKAQQKEEEELRAAIAISSAAAEQQARQHQTMQSSQQHTMPITTHHSTVDTVDHNIADIQRNLFRLKQALHIGGADVPAPSTDYHTYSGGVLHKVPSLGPSVSPMVLQPPRQQPQPYGVPHVTNQNNYLQGQGQGNGVNMDTTNPSPPKAVVDPRTLVKLVGGDLLLWLEQFHMRLEYINKLVSPRMGTSSTAENLDTLIFYFEFPAGMGPAIAGRGEEKLTALQRNSGCVLGITYDEDVKNSPIPEASIMRSGFLRIMGSIKTIPVFVKLLDAQMLGCLDYMQTRRFVPRVKPAPVDGRLAGVASSFATNGHGSNGSAHGTSPNGHNVNGNASSPSKTNRPSRNRDHQLTSSPAKEQKKERGNSTNKTTRDSRDTTRDVTRDTTTSADNVMIGLSVNQQNENSIDNDGNGSNELFFEVPEEHTGYVIGKQGFIIKSLMIKTGTFIQMVSQNPLKKNNPAVATNTTNQFITPNPGMSRFRIKGSEEGVELAVTQFRRNLAKIEVELTVLA